MMKLKLRKLRKKREFKNIIIENKKRSTIGWGWYEIRPKSKKRGGKNR